MKCQNLFSGKIKKKYFKMSSAETFTQHVKYLQTSFNFFSLLFFSYFSIFP